MSDRHRRGWESASSLTRALPHRRIAVFVIARPTSKAQTRGGGFHGSSPDPPICPLHNHRNRKDEAIAEIDRKIEAKVRTKMRAFEASSLSKTAFVRSCKKDRELLYLSLELQIVAFLRDQIIEEGFVPTLGPPGEAVLWQRPDGQGGGIEL
jgi:hypothetical protein